MNLIKDINLILQHKNETITVPIDFEVLRRKSIYFETIIKHDSYTVQRNNKMIHISIKEEITINLDHFDFDNVLDLTKQLIEHKQSEESILDVNCNNILKLLQLSDYFQFFDLDYLLSKLGFSTILDIDCDKKIWYAAHLIVNSRKNVIFEDVLKLYLEQNISIINDEVDEYGTLLFFVINTIYNGDNVIKILIDLGVDLDLRDDNGMTIVMYASRHSRTRKNIIKSPIKSGYDINLQTNDNNSLEAIVKMLIDAGANLDLQNNNGRSALMIASRNSGVNSTDNTVKMLIDAGANLDLQESTGWTALMMASRYSNNDSTENTVRMLIDAGANLDLQDVDGWTAFMLCSGSSKTDSTENTVKMFIDAGVKLDLQNNEGITALIASIIFLDSTENTIKILIDAGADVNLQTKNGDSVMTLAEGRGYDGIVSMIKEQLKTNS